MYFTYSIAQMQKDFTFAIIYLTSQQSIRSQLNAKSRMTTKLKTFVMPY